MHSHKWSIFNQCDIVSPLSSVLPAVRPAATGEYVLSGARSLTLLCAALGLLWRRTVSSGVKCRLSICCGVPGVVFRICIRGAGRKGCVCVWGGGGGHGFPTPRLWQTSILTKGGRLCPTYLDTRPPLQIFRRPCTAHQEMTPLKFHIFFMKVLPGLVCVAKTLYYGSILII